jgi:DNA-binding transcriptional LysR family regulator
MPMLNWDDVRIFLGIARDRSLLAGARRLGIDHTTASRRLTSLEESLGARLFDRSPRGLTLTSGGMSLLAYAQRIEAELLEASGDLSQRDSSADGSVRLATPEAFGTILIAPKVPRLHRRHPLLELELAPESRAVSLSKREADIAIGLTRPPKGRLISRRLADYRIGLYASREYLDRSPPLQSPDDVGKHPFIGYIDEYIDMPELRYLNQVVDNARTIFRSSSVMAQQAATSAGGGLALLHVFAATQDDNLVRLFPQEIEIIRSYWMIFHADQQRLPRVRAVIDFLEEVVAEDRERL